VWYSYIFGGTQCEGGNKEQKACFTRKDTRRQKKVLNTYKTKNIKNGVGEKDVVLILGVLAKQKVEELEKPTVT